MFLKATVLALLLSSPLPFKDDDDVGHALFHEALSLCHDLEIWPADAVEWNDVWWRKGRSLRWIAENLRRCRAYPKLEDCRLLPSAKLAEEMCLLLRNRHNFYNCGCCADDGTALGRGALNLLLEQVSRMETIWNLIREARTAKYPRDRRYALNDLRALVGAENYYRSQFPMLFP